MNNQPPTLIRVFGASEIAERVKTLGRLINEKYSGEPLLAVCALKGAFIFFGDLVRHIRNPELKLDFIRVASYGEDMESSRQIRFTQASEIDPAGKHVLIVDDIVDSGNAMRFMVDHFKSLNPLSVASVALVNKTERREIAVPVDYAGFDLPAGFLVGYGMDYAERYRQLPDICELKF